MLRIKEEVHVNQLPVAGLFSTFATWQFVVLCFIGEFFLFCEFFLAMKGTVNDCNYVKNVEVDCGSFNIFNET